MPGREGNRTAGIALAALCWLSACGPAAPSALPPVLPIADFDDGLPQNNIGGTFGVFLAREESSNQSCVMGFASEPRHGDRGYSMQLTYDVEDTEAAFNGLWMKMQNLDATFYNTLALRVAGAPGNCSRRIKVEMKNPRDGGSAVIDEIGTEFREYRIPFSEFRGLTDVTCLTEIVIVFDDRTVTDKTGVLYVDDIRLERSEGVAGTPASRTPASGTPASGTPASGTPASGTPASGTPAS